MHVNNDIVKNKIKNCSNGAYKTYDQYSSVQEKTSLDLIKILMLFDKEYPSMADFACGTGVGIKYLNKYVKYKKMYAIDFSTKLLSIAKEKYKHKKIDFILADFDKPILKNNSINLIFCNMGLQWSLDLKNTIKLFYNYLISSGRLAFSIPLDRTFYELNPIYRNAYYNEVEIQNMLTQAGFNFELIKNISYVERFSSQIEAIRSIKLVGANCKINGNVSISKVNDFFIDKSSIQLTYNVGIFLAKKLK